MNKGGYNANSLLKEQLDKYFKDAEKNQQELIHQISLLMFKLRFPDTELYDIFKYGILDIHAIDGLINFCDGKDLKMMFKKDWKDYILSTIVFYLKFVKGYNWN